MSRRQHLLSPGPRRVSINLRLLVALVAGTAAEARGGGCDDEEEEDDDDDDDEEEVCGHGVDGEEAEEAEEAEEGAREEAGCDTPAAPNGGAIARVCSGCNRKGGGGVRAPRASSDAAGYLHCLAWCAAMYLGGSCPDFGVSYSAHRAPTARQLASHLQEREAALGAPYKCRPSPHPPWP